MLGSVGTILGSFGVRLGLDSGGYTQGILQADALNQVFGQGVTTFLANPLLGAANALQAVGSGLIEHTTRLAGAAEETERFAQRTGATAELIQALGGRAEQAGFGFQVANDGIRTATQRLGEARQGAVEAQAVFAKLGIDVNQIESTDQLIFSIVEGLDRFANKGEQAAIAAKVLGEEAGTKFINLVGGGADALRALIAEQEALGQVLDSGTIASLAALNTQIGKSQQALAGLRDQFIANFVAGFVDETGIAKANIDGISSSIQTGLVPVARELGEILGGIAGDIDRIGNLADTIALYTEPLAMLVQATEFRDDAFDRVRARREAEVMRRDRESRINFAPFGVGLGQ